MSLQGITGRAGSGKDTFAEAFIKAGYRRISFAEPLKEAVAMIAGEPTHLYHSAEGKEGFSAVLNCTRRHALQAVGKGVRDVLDANVWVRRALDEWDRMGRPNAVITDVRYENEADLIRQFGGQVIRITRPGAALLSGAEAQHESERGIRDELVDLDVLNDGTIGELHAEARKVIAKNPITGTLALGPSMLGDPRCGRVT